MAEKIPIDLKEGYWPHFVPAFFARYGADSLFVRSVADSLTARHVRVLIKAGRISPNTRPLQRGTTEALESLEKLLSKMRADGAAEDLRHILRESMGTREPGVLQAEVDLLYGSGAFSRWPALFELHDFNQAAGVLRAKH
jgi:hypothetical protein